MTLRARILLLVLGVAGGLLLLFCVPTTIALHSGAQDLATNQATEAVASTADFISAGNTDPTTIRSYLQHISERDDTPPIGVMMSDGEFISVGGFPPDLASAHREPDGNQLAHEDSEYLPRTQTEVVDVAGGQLASSVVGKHDSMIQVLAYVSDDAVRGQVLKLGTALLVAAVVLLIIAGVAAELLSRRLVRQLTIAADTADRLGSGDLAARAPAEGPREVARVATALNRLAERIDELLVAERESLADLSHRLRTPLTVVRLDVESLPESSDRDELERHLDQLERMLTVVIHEARRPQREGAAPSADAAQCVRERLELWAPLLEDQGRAVESQVETGLVRVRCSAEDLKIALDALIENVVAHTDEGTALRMVIRRSGAQVAVEVCDEGPGVPPEFVARGRSDRGSSGLGLDIARRTAEASGGRLELDTSRRWSIVRMLLGPAKGER